MLGFNTGNCLNLNWLCYKKSSHTLYKLFENIGTVLQTPHEFKEMSAKFVQFNLAFKMKHKRRKLLYLFFIRVGKFPCETHYEIHKQKQRC